jgi:hypothetical protein
LIQTAIRRGWVAKFNNDPRLETEHAYRTRLQKINRYQWRVAGCQGSSRGSSRLAPCRATSRYYKITRVSIHGPFVYRKAQYCHNNPVKRRLIHSPEKWRWSSFRWLEQGIRAGEPVTVDDWIEV